MINETPSKLYPSLIGGAVMAVLSTLPIINLGNCLCCMWIMLGGGTGAYLYWKKLPPGAEWTSGDGALLGLLSGVFGALIGSFLNYFLMVFLGMGPDQDMLQTLMNNLGNVPEEFEEAMRSIGEGDAIPSSFVVLYLIANLFLDTLFGTVGGLLAAALLKKRSGRGAQQSRGRR
ncbi:DUF4199 domain-containing protein [bacterium]|nr:DUF4199 domain-containing protein [bacterium]